VRRYKVKPINPKACRCCLSSIADQEHHRQPKSQNGSDEPKNLVAVCEGCHSLYHTMTNQRLASTPKARVRNFVDWLAQWPGTETEVCGKKHGPHPYLMAPEWMVQEWADSQCGAEPKDLSNGCLSNLGKVSSYPIREHLK
jgi:hypothetical protein